MRLNLLVRESITARLPTLPRTAPACVLTWEIRPPNQMLVPTCSMALTRPSIIGVMSGLSEGNAARASFGSASMIAVNNNTPAAATSVLLVPPFHTTSTMSPPSPRPP